MEYTHAIKLTEKQIKQLIQILGGVEPIVILEAQTMKIWTFTEVIHSYIQYYILLKSMHGELGCHQRKEG
jgi:hypothetical protein